MKKFYTILIPLLIILAVAAGAVLARTSARKTTFINSAGLANGSLEDYYKKSQEIASQSFATSTATFLAFGDISLSRGIAAAIQTHNDPLFPFKDMSDTLKSVEFNFANLESPFYFNPKDPSDTASGIIGGHLMVFGSPIKNIAGLIHYNFKALNLANNHALDQGQKGILGTRQLLSDKGLQGFGAGSDLAQAWQPAVVEDNGIKICFIGASYASANDGGNNTNNYVARIEDTENLKASIQKAKSLCDFTVVTMHAGIEYTKTPNRAQVDFAHKAVDFGADLIIGAHPHWVQTTEKYQGKYIFYSLGNFIFDQSWSQDTKEGLALKIQISKAKTLNPSMPKATSLDDLQGQRIAAKLDSIFLIPLIIEDSGAPRPAGYREAKNILKKINLEQAEVLP